MLIHRPLLLALLLVPGAPARSAPSATGAETTALDDQWVSSCLAMGKDGRHGTIVRLTIAGTRIDAVAQTYAHAICDVPTIKTRLTARLDRATVSGGRVDAAVTIRDVTLTPEHPDVVTAWNEDRQAKGCGTHIWRLDTAQSVAGDTCTPGLRFPTRGAHVVVHASREGDTLRIPSPFADTAAGGHQAAITVHRAPAQ